MEKISIYEDGNCFFRCLAIYCLKEKLLDCRRMKNGRCASRNLFADETNMSWSLRMLIMNYIKKNINKFTSQNIGDCLINLEDETINEHLERMSIDGEFAEMLEVRAACDFLNITIVIWMNNGQQLNCVEKIGNNSDSLNLLLDDDHYIYLKTLPKVNINKDIDQHIQLYHKETLNNDHVELSFKCDYNMSQKLLKTYYNKNY